jgi:hypothetical protein
VTERIRVPLIIGITGKRDLQGKQELVRQALREAFRQLDREFRYTPKILLTALAGGADTIAAEAALEHAEAQRTADPARCPWQVLGLLPFDRDEYAKDFERKEDADRLRDLCKRTHAEVLPPLRRPVPGQPFELTEPFTIGELAKNPKGNPDRTAHYEQVGLYIADLCGLLIAVMPGGESPDRVGGTARIVTYQLTGALDDTSWDIVRRSRILAPLPLDRPQPGPAWVIDLDKLRQGRRSQRRAIKLWEPRPAKHAQETKKPAAEGPRQQADERIRIRKGSYRGFRRLWLATAIEAFNAELPVIDEAEWKKQVEDRAGKDTKDASSKLRRLRLALSLVQGGEKERLTTATRRLAVLFVFAIVALEVHIEFHSAAAIWAYVVLFLIIFAIFGRASWRRLQPHAEDYRALSEALRVQVAWWDAGLAEREDRVDRFYLGGTGGSLARLRTALRHLIDAAVLTSTRKHPPDPLPKAGSEEAGPVGESEQRWIESQIDFFDKRIADRHASASFLGELSWLLFIGAFAMALFIAAWTVCSEQTLQDVIMVDAFRPYERPGALLLALLVAFGLLSVQRLLSGVEDRLPIRSRSLLLVKLLNMIPGLVAGVLVATGVVATVVFFGPLPVREPTLEFAHKVLLITMIGAVAVAGAVRFYAEKLSIEHELFSYRDALLTFKRAREELEQLDGQNSPAAQRRRRNLLLAIGKEALEENEAWIRAHRLRPLEPVVGG